MIKKKTAPKKVAVKKTAAPTKKTETKKAAKTVAAKKKDDKAAARKSSKHIESLLALSRSDLESYFTDTSAADLLEVFEESYVSDLVNVLLDLKKSLVRQLFEKLAGVRKRAISEAVTLYYYKEYLMNPFPLDVGRLPNYYAILGLPRDVNPDDLKTAHRLLSKAHRTDSFSPPMRDQGEERLAEINDAYQQLNTPEKRTHTDTVLPNMNYLYPKPDQSWFGAVQRILH